MNYARLYNSIISRAIKLRGHPLKQHSYKSGFEIHHIKPVSFFPNGRKNPDAHQQGNLVYLTLREHFMAHWLLARMYGGKMSLAFAWMCIRQDRISSKAYERHRIAGLQARNADSEYIRRNLEGAAKREADPVYREKRNRAIQKVINTPEWKEAHQASLSGRLDDAAWVENLAAIQRDPARREIVAQICRERNADPEFQARAEEGLKLVRYTPEFRAAVAEGVIRREATPGYKERRRAGTDRARAEPGFRDKYQAGIDKRASNEEWRKNSYAATQRRNKTVIGTHLETGEVIRLHGKQEMLAAGFDNRGISACVTNPPRNKSHRGYSWRLALPEELP